MVQAKGPKRTERLPITPNLLANLKVWSSGQSKFDSQMLFAAASLFSFDLCSGENSLSPLPYPMMKGLKNVAVDCIHNPRILQVYLKASKMDPFRVGVNMLVGRETLFAQ